MTKIKAILTGQSRGLGAAFAQDLVARGVSVLGLSRQINGALVSTATASIEQVALDLGDTAVLSRWLASDALAHYCDDADLIVLINNAGRVDPVGPLAMQAPEDIAQAISLNVAAPLMLAAAVSKLHTMQKRILHVSSGAGRKSTPGWSVYCATKAALDHHARTVASDELHGVLICSMAPGVVDTDMQSTIRASDVAAFPQRARFDELKRTGALASPEVTAKKMLDYLFSDLFGNEPVNDVRDLV